MVCVALLCSAISVPEGVDIPTASPSEIDSEDTGLIVAPSSCQPTAKQQQAFAPTKTFRTATHTEPKKNQQTNKTINQTFAWQQHDNPCDLQ
jgi:hypothetical protein